VSPHLRPRGRYVRNHHCRPNPRYPTNFDDLSDTVRPETRPVLGCATRNCDFGSQAREHRGPSAVYRVFRRPAPKQYPPSAAVGPRGRGGSTVTGRYCRDGCVRESSKRHTPRMDDPDGPPRRNRLSPPRPPDRVPLGRRRRRVWPDWLRCGGRPRLYLRFGLSLADRNPHAITVKPWAIPITRGLGLAAFVNAVVSLRAPDGE
jgi:hypothetical protein